MKKAIQVHGKIISTLTLLFISIIIVSCSENTRTKKYGFSQTITLKPNERCLNATWKEDNLWYLTEDTVTHVTYFREKSEHGIVEGVVKIVPFE